MKRIVTLTIMLAGLLGAIYMTFSPSAPDHATFSHYTPFDVLVQLCYAVIVIYIAFAIGKLFKG